MITQLITVLTTAMKGRTNSLGGEGRQGFPEEMTHNWDLEDEPVSESKPGEGGCGEGWKCEGSKGA